MCLGPVKNLMFKPSGVIGTSLSSYHLKNDIQKLKAFVKLTFRELDDRNLFTKKFHTIYIATKDNNRFE